MLLAMLLAAASAVAETKPTLAGEPHRCPQTYYPPGPLLDFVSGRVIVSFTIGADGRVSGPAIARSSGNVDLDDAATRCVQHWTYNPATRDGKKVAVPWQAIVVWSNEYPLQPVAIPPCALPAQARGRAPGNHTTIAYDVQADGTTVVTGTAESSGDPVLDNAVANCIAKWRFQPMSEPNVFSASETVTWTPPD